MAEDPDDFLMFQVQLGDGVTPEEFTRLFLERLRAEIPVQGAVIIEPGGDVEAAVEELGRQVRASQPEPSAGARRGVWSWLRSRFRA
jgi:hypothetical protein